MPIQQHITDTPETLLQCLDQLRLLDGNALTIAAQPAPRYPSDGPRKSSPRLMIANSATVGLMINSVTVTDSSNTIQLNSSRNWFSAVTVSATLLVS